MPSSGFDKNDIGKKDIIKNKGIIKLAIIGSVPCQASKFLKEGKNVTNNIIQAKPPVTNILYQYMSLNLKIFFSYKSTIISFLL